MTGFGNSITTVTVPVEGLTVLCRPVYRRDMQAWTCPHCEGTPSAQQEDFLHAPYCFAAEVWAWAEATGGPAKAPGRAVRARIEKALGPA